MKSSVCSTKGGVESVQGQLIKLLSGSLGLVGIMKDITDYSAVPASDLQQPIQTKPSLPVQPHTYIYHIDHQSLGPGPPPCLLATRPLTQSPSLANRCQCRSQCVQHPVGRCGRCSKSVSVAELQCSLTGQCQSRLGQAKQPNLVAAKSDKQAFPHTSYTLLCAVA